MTSLARQRLQRRDVSIGVIIPSFDRPEAVLRAARSALRSAADEVIVVDDASSVPVDLGLIADPRLKLLRHDTNRGVCAARNTGMARAESSHLVFLDDDDALLPWAGWFYRRWIGNAVARHADCVVTGSIIVEGSGRRPHIRRPPSSRAGEIWGMDAHLVRRGRSINTKQAAAIPRTLFDRVGGWDEALRSRSSSEMFYRLTDCVPVVGYGMPVYRLNRGDHDKLTADPERRAESHSYVARKHSGLLADPSRRETFEGTHRTMLSRNAASQARSGETP